MLPKTTHTLHRIPLYLVDSVIQLLNNQGQYEKDFNMMGSCRSALFPTLQFFICFTWKLLAVSCLFFCSTLGAIIFSPRFQPPHCNFKTFCCLNTNNDIQIMISFFGRDLQSIDSIEQLVLFTFTLCAVVGIMSLFKHFNMLLVIYKKGTPLCSQ